MEATKVRSRADTLACIYENVKMGADSIVNLLPKVEDTRLKSDMSVQLSGYEEFAARARKELQEMGVEAEEKGFMTKAMAKVGMEFNTMMDTSISHIAEMMIQGSNMGIVEMNKLLNTCERCDSEDGAVGLAREIVAFEEKNLERMKKYL
jgi:uncharacterized protein YbjQ (UPF0145 family)